MKIYLLVLLSVFSVYSYAGSYSDALADEDVSHLELVVNNLNMIVITKSDELFNKEGVAGIEDKYIKFYLTKDNRLAVDSMHTAPVGMVTKSKCGEILSIGLEKLRGEESPIPGLISAVSLYEFKISDAKKFVGNSFVKVFLQAKENSELMVSCSNS